MEYEKKVLGFLEKLHIHGHNCILMFGNILSLLDFYFETKYE